MLIKNCFPSSKPGLLHQSSEERLWMSPFNKPSGVFNEQTSLETARRWRRAIGTTSRPALTWIWVSSSLPLENSLNLHGVSFSRGWYADLAFGLPDSWTNKAVHDLCYQKHCYRLVYFYRQKSNNGHGRKGIYFVSPFHCFFFSIRRTCVCSMHKM